MELSNLPWEPQVRAWAVVSLDHDSRSRRDCGFVRHARAGTCADSAIDINFAARARLLGFTPFLHQLRRLRTLLGLTPCAGSTHLRTHFAAVEHLDVS
jgi:hypothetical protein